MRRGRGGLYRCLYHSFLNNTSLLLPSSKFFNHITVLFLLFSTLWLQLELFLSSGTVCLSIYSLVAGIFGMNIPYTWNEDHGFMFKWVCNYLFHYLVNLGCEHLNAYKERLVLTALGSLLAWLIYFPSSKRLGISHLASLL